MTSADIGTGFSLPFSSDGVFGISMSKGIQRIRESIAIILGTQYGERLMRPTFGCNLKTLVFAPNNAGTASLARYYVAEGLKTWEPRITVDEVLVANDVSQARLMISIRYRVKSTNEQDLLTIPFQMEKQ